MYTRLVGMVMLLFSCCMSTASSFAADLSRPGSTFDIRRAPKLCIPYEKPPSSTEAGHKTGLNLRTIGKIPTLSPGHQIGTTTYDAQHNGTMGRQVARRGEYVHLIWTGQDDYIIPGHSRAYYQAFSTMTMSYTMGPSGVSGTDPDYSAYATIDCLNGPQDNAFFTCQVSVNGNADYHSVGYIDMAPGYAIFANYIAATMTGYIETIWPQICVHYGAASDVAYMLTHAGPHDGNNDMILYRKDLSMGMWDGGQIVGHCTDLSYTVVALDGTDKVAIVYTDDRNGLSQDKGGQYDLDLYYRESTDQGNTWSPRTCVSNYLVPDSLWRAFSDLSALYTTDGKLHIIWSARELWDATIYEYAKCRLLHWSTGYPHARTIAEARYDGGPMCDPGSWNLYIAKASISECDGKLYALWTQFLDRQQFWDGHGTDCSAKGFANGELWLSVSSDYGISWDLPENLTNSHTPECDSAQCESDHWSSMIKYGMVYSGIDTLDLIYINDKDAGGIPQGEGSWTVNPVKHLRIPCRESVAAPRISLYPNCFLDPIHTPPGTQLDTAVTISNIGNATLIWSASVNYQTYPGWINLNPASGAVQSGIPNTQVMNVTLNFTNFFGPDPSGMDAKIIVTSNAPTSPDTIPVHMTIASNFCLPQYATLNTAGKKLRVFNNGRHGGGTMGESLDIPNECDTSANPNGRMYLYDGSPVISWIKSAGDTVSYSTLWSQKITEQRTWRPQGDIATFSRPGYDSVSWTMCTSDSLFGVKVSCLVPTDGTGHFIVEKLDFYLWGSTTPKNNINVGWVADFDIPSDAGTLNAAGFDLNRATIWQRGAETGNIDEMSGCPIIENNRFGGLALLNAVSGTTPSCAWSAPNADAQHNGTFHTGFLYRQMIKTGYGDNVYSVYPPDPDTIIDLHSGMCFERISTMNSGTFYSYVIALVTTNTGKADYLAQVDAARLWAENHKLLHPYPYFNRQVGDWKFDEGRDLIANDASMLGNHGTLKNGPTWISGYSRYALRFDGIDDYVEIPDSLSLRIPGPFTMMAWVKPENLMPGGAIFDRQQYALQVDALGQGSLEFILQDKDGQRHVLSSLPNKLLIGRWQFVAAVWDGAFMRLYNDGRQVAFANLGATVPDTSNGLLRIGADFAGHYFTGAIDEARIYSYAVNAATISREAAKKLRGSWDCNEKFGNIAYDSSGFGNNAVLTEGPKWTGGMRGKAISFDGVDDYLFCGNDVSLDLTADMTLMAWAKFSRLPTDFSCIASRGNGPGQQDKWAFGYSKNHDGVTDALSFLIEGLAFGPEWVNSSPWVADSGKWHHLAVTRSDMTYNFYIDGQLHGQSVANNNTPPTNAPFLIAQAEGSYHFPGILDEIRAYGYALSGSEVFHVYEVGCCGDANGDLQKNIGDAVFLINYVFKSGPAPIPLFVGDTNCDSKVNVGDVVYMINFVFKGGNSPSCQ